jgi:hypothetical protein
MEPKRSGKSGRYSSALDVVDAVDVVADGPGGTRPALELVDALQFALDRREEEGSQQSVRQPEFTRDLPGVSPGGSHQGARQQLT